MIDTRFLYTHIKDIDISEDIYNKLINNKIYSVKTITTKTISELLTMGLTLKEVKYLIRFLKEHGLTIQNDCVFDDDKNQNQDEFNL